MTDRDQATRRILARIQAHHGPAIRTGRPASCSWCGTDWPCHVASLLAVMAQEAERYAETIATLMEGR